MTQKEVEHLAQQLADRAFDREYGWLGSSVYARYMEEGHGYHTSFELRPKYQDIYDDLYCDYLIKLNNRYGFGTDKEKTD